MQVKNISVQELLNRLRLYFLESDITKRYANEAPPLRAELFSTEQLDEHGKYLAGTHNTKILKAKERLLKRLANNEKILLEVHDLLTDTIKQGELVMPAGEWLLDNFYLIEEHIRTGKKHLPKGYSEGLPRLTNTASAGLPRVYDIAQELVAHSDGRIDLESLTAFITAYQEVTYLKIGELWAIPIMLRLALIENLRRVAVRVALDRINQSLANFWATQMIETAEKDPKSLILVIADMARSGPPMESSFVAEMIRRLMWKGSSLALPLTWIEQRLSEVGLTSNELVNKENQKQAADQVSISNSIGSLRFLGSVEWHEFVERLSVVEHTLRKDAGGIYPEMDFATRDRYRHSVEKIAKNGRRPENEVALVVVQLAQDSFNTNASDKRTAHVGYYLIDEGLKQVAQIIKQQIPAKERFRELVKRRPMAFYAGSIMVITVAITTWLLTNGFDRGINIGWLVLTGIVSLIGASQLATSVINWLATLVIDPDLLPRFDFTEGIPVEFKTLVVVPAMLTTPGKIEQLVESLEVRFLANKCKNLHFGLLTDMPDANEAEMPEDTAHIKLAKEKIEELNEKYAASGTKFFLFHRPRKWNNYDKIWMGYERKRGKLTELNELLRGKGRENFSLIVGDLQAIANIKYIITLDTDTQLPRDTGRKLVGTMAHPLNQPCYDEKKGRITKGYGILQPRVAVSIPGSGNSLYAEIHSSEPGIDPYTRLTSDLYQDMFNEGSFIGKGIYDIDAFETTLHDKLPENRILSHDLLEGCFTRSGLLSDVQFYEEYPVHYSADVNRRHRWIRGDWQIGYWALPFAPDHNNKLRTNHLSVLSRWKIFDNLRRSLVPLSLTLLLFLGWTVMHAAWFWTITVVMIVILPALVISVWNVFRKPKDVTFVQHISISVNAIMGNLFRDLFVFICLPYEAYYTVDAILRTSWRMLVSHRKLLEWVPSSGGREQTSDRTVAAAYRSMWISPAIAAVAFVYLVICAPAKLIAVTPVIALWTLAPLIAWRISKPFEKYEANLTDVQLIMLRKLSRKTWAFFENFVGPEDNWLPPDNFQESPNNAIAHRTSPTNIGLALLSNLAAYDFGYITRKTLIENTANTMNTLDKMERYRGHLYNWYDTVTLKPLFPRYISTVDSGNMAGHLLTLRQGLLELSKTKISISRLLDGLLDIIYILEDELPGNKTLTGIKVLIRLMLNDADENKNSVISHLKQLADLGNELQKSLEQQNYEAAWWTNTFITQCANVREEVAAIDEITGSNPNVSTEVIEHLAAKCAEYADIEFEFLYDRSKHLLAIGYNAEDHVCDLSFYDLLASEARLSNFIAIAQGKLPQESWFSLNRSLANVAGAPLLISWSGSMFEYLMPLLVMPTYENTLLDRTNRTAVARQIEYGNERNVPWGISESCYNMVDANLNYQYRAFGVPGLGLKRGLAEDLVIAPYATVLALMVDPEAACNNIEQLNDGKFAGRYGLYESIDYTPSRVPRGQQYAVINAYMAHHQGMSMLSLAYVLLRQPMQKRFEAELEFQATLLLLQERVPRATNIYKHESDVAPVPISVSGTTEIRIFNTPNTAVPEVKLLSNGKYNVLVSNAGGGYSRWKELAVTRWREDTTSDNWGSFCYIRDLEDGTYWSNTYQPTLKEAEHYEATFSQGRAEFRRTDNKIETHTEIVVSPEDDIEMRRLHITNRSRRRRIIEVTSYAEVVLNAQAADAIHPAFNNLFIQTEIVEHKQAILCTRRPRSAEERPPWMLHLMMAHDVIVEEVSFETDRSKFIGRGNTIVAPEVMLTKGQLSNTQGAVLDPVVAIRCKFTLEAEQVIVIDMISGIATTKDICQALIEKYQDKHHKDRVFELAWTHSQVLLRQINATEADALLYEQLAGSIVYINAALRADPAILLKNERGQSGLWGYSVSGDLPIVLLQIEDQANIELAKQLVQAHTYWRLKGLAVDLVIWNEDHGGYRQNLQNQINELIAADAGSELSDYPGGIYMRSSDQISNEDRILFQTVARINICDKQGSLEDHLSRKNSPKNIVPLYTPLKPYIRTNRSLAQPADLGSFNGFGGFSDDGREYVIITGSAKSTPAPWINVLTNPSFGCIISEAGQSYTWIENAHEFRLTPWDNDPVCDTGGEAFYIRDEETGHYWSPTLLPATGTSAYVTRHGFGYSIFEHNEDNIMSGFQVYVDIAEPVKYFVLKLKNASAERRHLSVTGFMDFVLGDMRSKTAMHIITEVDTATSSIFAKNPYNKEFGSKVVFFGTDETNINFTADRAEFLGRNKSARKPEAMSRVKLSGKAGAALDPCGAIQTNFVLEAGQEREIIFRLGVGTDMMDAVVKAQKFKGSIAAHNALQQVKKYWEHTLTALQVDTPDPALNTIANGWLMYQVLASRLWARSGYYQSGGAFGFRDQLQDILAVMRTQPSIARAQILLSASRQFPEGDVQHWWHPPAGRGVRTLCSDDMLWLPFSTSGYIAYTGDTGILNENVFFLEGRLLNPDEESYYDLPTRSDKSATLYDHCIAAIKHAMRYGEHGLPLMGTGDWNDGMDMVGKKGKGESVWLAFFLYDVLIRFSKIAGMQKDEAFAKLCTESATQLSASIEKNAWDGNWYRRAYFDDGTPLGTASNEECRIDSISQSWSVISGGANPERAAKALAEADKELVDTNGMLIKLLSPPFDKSALNPGYIKGYVPGIRENGGQYTHAAVWLIIAHAISGNAKRAWELMDMINPLNHGDSAEKIAIYKTEPYVVAADVYSIEQNRGRGGWTWYTGSAGWMYQLITEWLLGIRCEGNKLSFKPCVPAEWDSFKVTQRYQNTKYHITFLQGKATKGEMHIELDGIPQSEKEILLVNDGGDHRVVVSF